MKLHGLIAATYTPMHTDGTVNLKLIAPMIDWMIKKGVSGFYVCGSTGEGPTLTESERKSVAEVSVAATAGRKPVVVQVGSNSQLTACELARHAAEIGADAISAVPPYYFKPGSVEQLVESMAPICDAAPQLPFYYYHIPALTGVHFDMVEFLELGSKRLSSLAGIKYSNTNLADFKSCQEVADGRFDLPFGSDEMMLAALAMGAKGAVGSCYGFAAPLWTRIIAAFEAGDQASALKHQSDGTRMVRFLARNPGPFQAMVKQVVWPSLGFDVGSLRAPQLQLSQDQVSMAKTRWEELGYDKLIQ
ncbi:MAG: dihydrodipicolinate synthase family protein [Verrucomicrobia bacterium]|nr:dihydrodipicolinate synthase family protein [Verrucomicrobiota bacterium]